MSPRALQKSSRGLARRWSSGRRGVALLLVVISIAILTVMGTEFAYNSRVDLQLASNQRDEVRAYFLARGGIGLGRLMLRFQRQLDQATLRNVTNYNSELNQFIQQQLDPTHKPSEGGAPQEGSPAPTSMTIQVWRMAKIDCHMLQGLTSRGEEASAEAASSSDFEFDKEYPELAQKQALRSFGTFEGCFNVQISDEEEKINLNKLDGLQSITQVLLSQLLGTLSDKRYEFLFEKEDSNKVRATPQEVVSAMRDWVDEDELQTQLNLSGTGDPFVRGFSDENYLYDRYQPRYQAKNARFDSLEELAMVHGINDRFLAAFRDKVTVYPDVNSKLNVNTDDPMLLELAIRSVADPARPDIRLADPIFIDTLIKKIRIARIALAFGMSVLDFVTIVESNGIAVNQSIKSNAANQPYVGDKSSTFRIQSVGEAGAVRKTITTVVRTNDSMGTLVYWREE